MATVGQAKTKTKTKAPTFMPAPTKPAKPGGRTARKDGLAHVFWTDDERRALADKVAALRARGEAPNDLKALRIAQAVLLPERRRKLLTVSGEKWLLAALKDAELRRMSALVAADVAKVAATKTPEASAAPAVPAHAPGSNGAAGPARRLPAAPEAPKAPEVPEMAPAAQEAPESEALPTPWVGESGALAARLAPLADLRARLVDELALIIGEACVKALGALAGTQATGLQAHLTAAVPAFHDLVQPPAVRPTVLVAGLQGQQKDLVLKRFGRHLDLRFVAPAESKDQFRIEAERAKMAVVMTDHLSTSQVDIVRARTKSLIEQPGGPMQLNATLARMAFGSAAQ